MDRVKPKVLIVGHMGECREALARLAKTLQPISIEIYNESRRFVDDLAMQHGDRDCKLDHGERTNHKLKDQPFYMRGRTGKMRGW